MQKITPCLWFDHHAEEAARFYTSLFPNSEITFLNEIPEGPSKGNAWVGFRLDGQDFVAFDGGPAFTFSLAISMFVRCESQGEIDRLWEALSDGGEILQCGWLKDRYGLP